LSLACRREWEQAIYDEAAALEEYYGDDLWIRLHDLVRAIWPEDESVAHRQGACAGLTGAEWRQAVLESHASCAIYGAVVSELDPRHEIFVDADHLDRDAGTLWSEGVGQRVFPRESSEIANVCRYWLLECGAVHLVEPNFKLIPRFVKPLEALLRLRAGGDPCDFVVYCKQPRDDGEDLQSMMVAFERKARTWLSPSCGRGTRVSFKFIAGQERGMGRVRVHNRYLLTAVGGVKFGDSIEQGAGDLDHATVLDSDSCRWATENFVELRGVTQLAGSDWIEGR
jgi:hypothetical protein